MIPVNTSGVYNIFTNDYDQWFEKHPNLYQSELLAVKQAVPAQGVGIEIGVGTGRSTQPLNIKYSVESSDSMAQIVKERGVKISTAVAENLPIENQSYDFVIMVNTVCFLSGIPKAFSKVLRILKPRGEFVIGLLDRHSELGIAYEQQKRTNKFYKDAHFHSTQEITGLLTNAGFHSFTYWQTLTNPTDKDTAQPIPGFGSGIFIYSNESSKTSTP